MDRRKLRLKILKIAHCRADPPHEVIARAEKMEEWVLKVEEEPKPVTTSAGPRPGSQKTGNSAK